MQGAACTGACPKNKKRQRSKKSTPQEQDHKPEVQERQASRPRKRRRATKSRPEEQERQAPSARKQARGARKARIMSKKREEEHEKQAPRPRKGRRAGTATPKSKKTSPRSKKSKPQEQEKEESKKAATGRAIVKVSHHWRNKRDWHLRALCKSVALLGYKRGWHLFNS